jgi:hypothetical protein
VIDEVYVMYYKEPSSTGCQVDEVLEEVYATYYEDIVGVYNVLRRSLGGNLLRTGTRVDGLHTLWSK